MRDDQWLNERLNVIQNIYFLDIDVADVYIKFYGKARYRLGSIRKIDKISHIRVNGALADAGIPDFIIDEVIAHELVHYYHGFGSSRERFFKYPHRGGIVEMELQRRGAGHLRRSSKSWLESNWHDHLDLFLVK